MFPRHANSLTARIIGVDQRQSGEEPDGHWRDWRLATWALQKRSLPEHLYQNKEKVLSGHVGQNPVPLVNIKTGGTWVFIRPKMEA